MDEYEKKRLLGGLITVSRADFTHDRFSFCGVGVNIRRKHLRSSDFSYPEGTDITKIPPAEGLTRTMQLGELAVLQAIDRCCRAGKIDYWLDWGTLLGAYRHRGFIPWDDDVDLAMMREDFEKFPAAFNSGADAGEFFCEVMCEKRNPSKGYYKVRHRRYPMLAVDIFVMDFYPGRIAPERRMKFTRFLRRLRKLISLFRPGAHDPVLQYRRLLAWRDKYIYRGRAVPGRADKPDIFYGIDFPHNAKCMVVDYDTIFPLGTIRFENGEFPVPNRVLDLLKAEFDAPMSFPPSMIPRHTDPGLFTREELREIELLGANAAARDDMTAAR